jgi:hypothetical protein
VELLKSLMKNDSDEVISLAESDWQQAFAGLLVAQSYSIQQAQSLLTAGEQQLNSSFESVLRLNSVEVDLTSAITKLTNT